VRVLFSGGGTGGHLYPTLALAQALRRGAGDEGVCKPAASPKQNGLHGGSEPQKSNALHAVLFVGARGNMDEALLTRDDVPYRTVKSQPLTGLGNMRAALSLAGNAAAVMQAVPIVSHFRPNIIVGSGGYACAPSVVAGAMLRRSGMLLGLRIVLLEPNVNPGMANRRLARYANEVWGGYADSGTSNHFGEKFVLTGVPVRDEFGTPVPKAEARRSLGLDPERFTVLVFGGSQGARTINTATSGMVARRRLPPQWQVLHLTGERDYSWMVAERKAESNENSYVVKAYLDTMALSYWAADVAVCRAGASTLAELCAVGLPAILVPYPHASEDHQRENAEYFVRNGAAHTVGDTALTPDSLYWQLVEAAEPAKLAAMNEKLRRLAHPEAMETMLARLLDGTLATPA
jgi:UDP-N-acetylglucosamine--N-acetylmuramyl-(pentapeptide) pyrophosphoryl-undecaprenol N-acetylglucosamine transferase